MGKTWLDTYRTECNPMQRRQYQNFINYASKHFGKKMLRSITATDVQRLYNTLSGYSQSHINKFLPRFAVSFGRLCRDGVIIRSLCGDGPAAERTVREPQGPGNVGAEVDRNNLCGTRLRSGRHGDAVYGLRRGEVLYLDVDRDVDFQKKTLTVRGAVSFCKGNRGVVTEGKTANAQRTIPMADPFGGGLCGAARLLLTKEDGMMSQAAFDRKYQSYITFLERKLNGYPRCQYGRTRAHKVLLAEGKPLPPFQEIDIRCHDFRVTFLHHLLQRGHSSQDHSGLDGPRGHEARDGCLYQAHRGKGTGGRAAAEPFSLPSDYQRAGNRRGTKRSNPCGIRALCSFARTTF